MLETLIIDQMLKSIGEIQEYADELYFYYDKVSSIHIPIALSPHLAFYQNKLN